MAIALNSRVASGVSTLFSRPKNTSALGSNALGRTPGLPALALDFANGNQLDPRIAFTRASSASYFDRDGYLKLASSGTPRFDHDPVTGVCKGLLIEESRTNLLTYSEQFDNAAWSKNAGVTVTANTDAAPDGTITADTVVFGSSNISLVGTSSTSVNGSVVTGSFYVKGTYGETIQIAVGGVDQIFTLDGTWQRLSATKTAINSTLNVNTFGGSTARTIKIWGAQLEVGSFPTSYIPTTTAQATRAADLASITGANFSSWYNQTEGTLFAESDSISAVVNCGIVSPNDGTANNRLQLFCETNAAVSWYATAGGTNTLWSSGGNRIANTPFKVAGAYATNNAAISFNGASAVTDSSVAIPTVSQLSIGSLYSGGSLNGHIKRLAYYQKRLSNTELQALTA